MAAVNTVGIPGLALLHRTEEHLVKAQRVGTVFLNNHIGIHHVEHRFRHLLDGPAADIFAVFSHKLSVVVFGAPCFEGLNVENIVGDNVHIHVDRCHVGVVILQVEAHKHGMSLLLAGHIVAVYEVGAALNHTLVHQFLERFFLATHSVVEEELVPEARIDEVSRGMLGTSHVEIHVLPVFISLFADQCLGVVRIHIAQIIGA